MRVFIPAAGLGLGLGLGQCRTACEVRDVPECRTRPC